MQARRLRSRKPAARWGWLGAGAIAASAVGYELRARLDYVSKPPLLGELEFYGLFALLAVVALLAAAVAARPLPGRSHAASRWGWAGTGAAFLSAIGYVVQTIFDHVDEPPTLGEVEFYGLLVGMALLALLTGCVAVFVGRRRGDLTMRLGFFAVAYVLLAQLIQSLWD